MSVENDHLPFDKEIQFHILKMMTKSDAFLIKCASHLEKSFFEDSTLGWFFSKTVEYHSEYFKPIEITTLRNEILKIPAEKRFVYERVLEKIEASNYTDENYLRNELTGWVRSRKFIKLHQNSRDLFNSNQRESAYNVTEDSIAEIKKIDFTDDASIDFTDLDIFIEKASKTHERRIPLGIPQIDNAMLGGLMRGGLTTILGGTNIGKSVMLINIAYNAILNNKRVLFIYHEGARDQIIMRFASRFAKIPYMKFYGGINNLSPEERDRLNRAKVLLSEKMVLMPMVGFNTTIEDVIGYCKQKKVDFDFDIVICDYGQLLSTRNAANEYRHNQATVHRGLASLGAELDVVVVTVAQGNKTSQTEVDKGKKLLGITDIAECFEIIRCSECVITLSRSANDQQNNRIKILLAKQRDGVTNIAVDCVTDFKMLTTYSQELGIYDVVVGDGGELKSEGQLSEQQLNTIN